MSIPTSFQYWQLPPVDERSDEHALRLKTSHEIPQPDSDEVLIRVHAVSLNHRDLMITRNNYRRDAMILEELVPASDGAGEVLQVGRRVKRFQPGDRVVANFNRLHLQGPTLRAGEDAGALGGPSQGMLSQLVVLPANSVVSIPAHLSYEEAATLPCAGVTAWNSLFGLPGVPVLPGATVVAEGTGGVSVFAAQFAIASGAKAIVTSSSDDKLDKIRNLFSAEQQKRLFLVNYKRTPDWEKEVRKVAPHGASHIVDVGGEATLQKAFESVKWGGVVANVGFVGGAADAEAPKIHLLNLRSRSNYRGVYVGSVELFEQMNECIEAHAIRPVVDRTFALEDAPQAFTYLSSQAHVGKVVIKV